MRHMPLCPSADLVDNDRWRQTCTRFAERLAENAVVVNGIDGDDDAGWTQWEAQACDTHTAILLDVQPLKKVDPLVEKLRNLVETIGPCTMSDTIKEAADKIEAQT